MPSRVPTRKEILALRPQRNPALPWHEEDERVVLTIKRRPTGASRLLAYMVHVPQERRVVLDELGSAVWRLLDGQRTLGQIARVLGREYQLSAREAELSLQQYFKELGRRGYIGFWVPDTAPVRETAARRPPDGSSRRDKRARKKE